MTALLAGLFLVGCDKDEDNSLKFNFNNIEIVINTTEKIKVSGGEQAYTAKSSDEAIAKATVDKDVVNVQALEEGAAVITVTDKNGKTGLLNVRVAKPVNWKDSDAEDATTRIVWGDLSKKQGTDEGSYTFARGENKSVSFGWSAGDDKNSIALTFYDPNELVLPADASPSARESVISSGKLIVTTNGTAKEYGLSAWSLMQKKAFDGAADVFWVAFKAENKWGYLVAHFAE